MSTLERCARLLEDRFDSAEGRRDVDAHVDDHDHVGANTPGVPTARLLRRQPSDGLLAMTVVVFATTTTSTKNVFAVEQARVEVDDSL